MRVEGLIENLYQVARLFVPVIRLFIVEYFAQSIAAWLQMLLLLQVRKPYFKQWQVWEPKTVKKLGSYHLVM